MNPVQLPIALFDYELPPERIAQRPAPERDDARLMVLGRRGGVRAHGRFPDLGDHLRPGDALVLNDSRVLHARLLGKRDTGGEVEVLLLRRERAAVWQALVRSAKRPQGGFRVEIAPGFTAAVRAYRDDGTCEVELHAEEPLAEAIERHGRVPLPPYIDRPSDDADRERYQTVYADRPGSVAAPTAGLHFTRELLAALEARGVEVVRVTLDVGLGTFQPIREDDVVLHRMHAERYAVSPEAAARLNRARAIGGKIFAAGTTAVRALETVVDEAGTFTPAEGETRLYLHPGSPFRAVDGMLTNFHLPRSSLLVLVAAFLGREATLEAYGEALARGYRFFSYGDAMLVLPEGR